MNTLDFDWMTTARFNPGAILQETTTHESNGIPEDPSSQRSSFTAVGPEALASYRMNGRQLCTEVGVIRRLCHHDTGDKVRRRDMTETAKRRINLHSTTRARCLFVYKPSL